jgi:hypothetical protein
MKASVSQGVQREFQNLAENVFLKPSEKICGGYFG